MYIWLLDGYSDDGDDTIHRIDMLKDCPVNNLCFQANLLVSDDRYRPRGYPDLYIYQAPCNAALSHANRHRATLHATS